MDIQEGLQDLLIIEAKGKEYLLPFEAPYVRIEEEGILSRGYSRRVTQLSPPINLNL